MGEFRWPGEAKAAVALTYDDAIPSHYEKVAPALEKAGLRTTFFIMARDLECDDLLRWREVASRGHELGNHSVFHPCRRNPPEEFDWLDPAHDLQDYSPSRLHAELRAMNLMLHLIDGEIDRTYGNTCSDTTIGPGESQVPIREVLESLVIGARGEMTGSHVDPQTVDLYQLAGYSGDGRTFADLRGQIEAAMADGGLVCYMFHGVGQGTHSLWIEQEEHNALIGWLSAERNRVWTAPLREIVRHIRQARER